MFSFTKVISVSIDRFKRQTAKVLRFGNSDAKEQKVALPFGVDSAPIKDLIAVHAETSVRGKSVIIGYLNKQAIAGAGESRIFATDSSGNLANDIYIKNNGDILVGGQTDNFVKFTALNSSLQLMIIAINAEFTKVSAAIANLGGAYTPTPITLDISSVLALSEA